MIKTELLSSVFGACATGISVKGGEKMGESAVVSLGEEDRPSR